MKQAKLVASRVVTLNWAHTHLRRRKVTQREAEISHTAFVRTDTRPNFSLVYPPDIQVQMPPKTF